MIEVATTNFRKAHHKIWLYRFLGGFTIIYLILQLAAFHLQEAMPPEIVFFWMATLLSYTVLKEAFRYGQVDYKNNQKGEIYTMLVIGTFLWMNFFNIIRSWFFDKEFIPLPHFMFESAVEALLLLVLSAISHLWFHTKCNSKK